MASQDAGEHPEPEPAYKDSFTEYILVWINTKNFRVSVLQLLYSNENNVW